MKKKLALEGVDWFFYCVIGGILHVWVALIISIWTGTPAIRKPFIDGSLLVVSIVLVAASYKANYDRIVHGYKDNWPPIAARIGASLITFPAVIIYTLTVFPEFTGGNSATPTWAWMVAVVFLIAGSGYGVGCHLLGAATGYTGGSHK